jgi:phosphorylcholine metabolism protein LicD
MDKIFLSSKEQILIYSNLSDSEWLKVRPSVVSKPPYDSRGREQVLKDTFKVLNEINVKFWLSGGSLLGAIRENDFIAWDGDIDLLMMVEDFLPVMNEIKIKLISEGFIVRLTSSKKFPKASFFKNGFKVSIGALLKKNKWRIRPLTKCPAYLFENEEFIEFKNMRFRVPSPADDYLNHVYGDWRTPKKSSKYIDYVNPDYFRSKFLYKQKIQAIQLIKKILNK